MDIELQSLITSDGEAIATLDGETEEARLAGGVKKVGLLGMSDGCFLNHASTSHPINCLLDCFTDRSFDPSIDRLVD